MLDWLGFKRLISSQKYGRVTRVKDFFQGDGIQEVDELERLGTHDFGVTGKGGVGGSNQSRRSRSNISEGFDVAVGIYLLVAGQTMLR